MRTTTRRWSFLLGQVFFVILCCYLVLQLVMGQRGLLAYYQSRAEEQELSKTLKATVAERERMEGKVGRMGEQSLDLDLLDEQARRILGYSRSDEQLYLAPEEAP